MKKNSLHGVIDHSDNSNRKTDYLFRISLKGLIKNNKGEVLVVKEAGKSDWDLPGGGLDHGEGIKASLAREMKEEVNLAGDFTYDIIRIDEPRQMVTQDIMYIRAIFAINPVDMSFSVGEDGDEIAFVNPDIFKNSEKETERLIYQYSNIR